MNECIKLKNVEETAFSIAQEEFAKKDIEDTYLNAAGYYLTQAMRFALEKKLRRAKTEINGRTDIAELLDILTKETGYTNAEIADAVSDLSEFEQRTEQDENYFLSEETLAKDFPIVEAFIKGVY